MPKIQLYDCQRDAIKKMKNGCILCGGVGSGKSRTSLGYFYSLYGGCIDGVHEKLAVNPPPLYIITTARKRDTSEWEQELIPFCLSCEVTVDSWNNIGKHESVQNSFFIFDEQRVVGYGAWVKAFLKIAKANQWILLSATPGDSWIDYIPVFIANGFYKNKSDFVRQHVVYSRYSKFPKVDKYLNTGHLVRLRNDILVDIDFERKTIQHHEDVYVGFDILQYKSVYKDRWNVYANKPIENPAELCYTLRQVVNRDISRQIAVMEILEKHSRAIVFYNYDYELDILKSLNYGPGFEVAEWNGHKHQPIPETDKWVYLVQYTAGAEGWNCVKTDTIIFYSQNYSYKATVQASGRIDRANTPYVDLYFYHLKSRSGIDLAISSALKHKKNFNEKEFAA